MERAYTVKAIVLIFQDEWFSMEGNSPALFTMEHDYYSLQGDLPIHLFMLQAHCGYQLVCSTSHVTFTHIDPPPHPTHLPVKEKLRCRKCACVLYYLLSDKREK